MPRAGLSPARVVDAGADLADELGLPQLSMNLLAERLGVRTPSLYKHVTGLGDLTHRIAVLGMTQLGDAIGDATRDVSGRDALVAAAHTMRTYIKAHAGRYAALDTARPTGPEDPLVPAGDRLLEVLGDALHGYGLDPDQEIHALRALRSTLHGFATIEAAGGFMIETDVDKSFVWLVDLLDDGLRQAARPRP